MQKSRNQAWNLHLEESCAERIRRANDTSPSPQLASSLGAPPRTRVCERRVDDGALPHGGGRPRQPLTAARGEREPFPPSCCRQGCWLARLKIGVPG
eukprot:6195709-Pleurochrysis_carterae.AAC.4